MSPSVIDPTQPLAGRVALVTGAAGVIGAATAALLAERGATVACVIRRSIEGVPRNAAQVLQADMTQENQVQTLVSDTLRQHGRIDIFVNNAGVEGPQAALADYSAADFMRVMQVNVLGVFLGLKHVLPAMIDQGCGSIINMASIASVIGAPRMGGYIASKHAVLGLTRTAALEAAPFGVRVNAVLPGFIESRMLSDIAGRLGGDTAGLASRVPAGRLGQPDEVAKAVAFLASDDSRYMNGAEMVLDGGLTVG